MFRDGGMGGQAAAEVCGVSVRRGEDGDVGGRYAPLQQVGRPGNQCLGPARAVLPDYEDCGLLPVPSGGPLESVQWIFLGLPGCCHDRLPPGELGLMNQPRRR